MGECCGFLCDEFDVLFDFVFKGMMELVEM